MPSPKNGEPWFDEPDLIGEKLASAPSDFIRNAAEIFIEQGYVVFADAVPLEACDAAIEAFKNWCGRNEDKVNARKNEYGHLPRLINLHMKDKRLLDLFVNNRILALQDFLFGAPTSVYTSLYYESGSSQPVHRDAPYFRTVPENHFFGMWIALQDATRQNGALEVVAGGHKVDYIDPVKISRKHYADLNQIPTTDQKLWDDYQAEVSQRCAVQGLKSHLLEVKKGSTIIWHPLLPHGGSEIKDATANRHSIVYHVVPARKRVYQGELFFNPDRKTASDYGFWRYRTYKNRQYLSHLRGTRFG